MASAPTRVPMPSTPWRTFREEPPLARPSNGLGMLGGLAIAVGLGVLGVHMLDLHSHKCDVCGRRWRHFGAFNLGDEESHRCSSCGEVQWWKCGVPHVLRGSQFVAPPSRPALAPGLGLHANAFLPSATVPVPMAPPVAVPMLAAPALARPALVASGGSRALASRRGPPR